MTRDRRGYTLIEMVVVMVMLAVVVAVAVPRGLKTSPQLQVDLGARGLTRDLEKVRMRAIAVKRRVRVSFVEGEGFYTAYVDMSPGRSGTIEGTADEVHESRLVTRGSSGGIPGVNLPKGVVFGFGDAAAGPLGASVSDPITLEGDRVEFDSRGMIVPAGTGGVIFLTHEDDPSAVAAVSISGAGAFRAWRYRGGGWSE
ncbi:MAG: prepilin-type N-terminal cleavage/methylation domain-containing protein [Gemmatimonadetes bacterium]|nr:prepilin-type N-terminal cleavage/methylation domain-containing protein [Gemmatimonadota bacterium]NIO31849.1 prepilin-type N-terminal cleavage/methylation domain-containing protein [Gemmatimonadota bacterium]